MAALQEDIALNRSSSDSAAGCVVLPQEALLELTGQDALSFLQGQTTVNFATPIPNRVAPGAFCDVKGRVIADFLSLTISAERVLLRVSASLADPLREHLRKYLMFARAELVPSPWRVAAALGTLPHASLGVPCPDGDSDTAIPIDGGYAVPRGPGQSELFLSPDRPLPDTGSLTPAHWRRTTLARGEARIEAETMGRYLPQDLNYDTAGWVDFGKGCYTGQEIIARLHWRGTPKRRLHLATMAGDTAPAPGSPLRLATGDKNLGSVVNAVAETGRLFLAVETSDTGLDQGLVLDGTDLPLTRWTGE